ncbi:MAG: response regulator [Succinivibrio sp.]|nr:response regulator [Succinivibrio sp.]
MREIVLVHPCSCCSGAARIEQAWDRLRELAASPLAQQASDILLLGYSAMSGLEEARRNIQIIREIMPRAKGAGITLNNRDRDLLSSEGYLSVQFFEKSSVQVLESTCCEQSYPQLARDFGQQLDAIPNLKAVQVFCSGTYRGFDAFLQDLSRGREDICFFGATAGYTAFETDCDFHQIKLGGEGESYVVGNQGVYPQGVVLIAYSGAALKVHAEAELSWKRVGKAMRITSAPSPYCVEKIDDQPASDIYLKYLNVPADSNMLMNICEFPLVVERNGMEIARIPPVYDERHRLHFRADLYEGEEIRLSYASARDLLHSTESLAWRMHEFGPEMLHVVQCANRLVFLKDLAHYEDDCFKYFYPNTLLVRGNAEIFLHHGQGGVLNSALVAVGLREADEPVELVPEHQGSSVAIMLPAVAPLAERLSHFLAVTTDELREKAQAADAANEAKSQFLSNMSHEIRTPINAILGMNELILRESNEPQIREYAANIQSASTALLGLINDILDFSKIEAGRLSLINAEYALSSLIHDLYTLIEQRAAKKGLTFKVQADPALPSVLFGDEIRLKQIITNLLTNAVKYTHRGEVTLKLFGTVEGDRLHLHCHVTDTGIGIKEEDLPKLTVAFERIEEKRNRNVEGTGLGMSITTKLLALMHSKLEVHSVYGQGSDFSFVVEQQVLNTTPLGDLSESYSTAAVQTKPYRRRFIAPKARILVVDDTLMNLTVIKGLLKDTQVGIDTAQSGPEGLNSFELHDYDCVLLDHRMPGMDGIETLAHLKESAKFQAHPVPVIALTANAVSGAREQYLKAGFDDYLSKPVSGEALEKALEKHLPPDKLLSGLSEDQPEPSNLSAGDDHKLPEISPVNATGEGGSSLPHWLTQSKLLDTAAGVVNCGSEQNYLEILKVFYDSIEAAAQELENFLRNRDYENFTIKVHALKSSARIVGARELSERARRLENAGINGYHEEIENGTPALLDLYREYRSLLAPLVPENARQAESGEGEPEAKPALDEPTWQEAREALHSFASGFDYDNLQYVLNSLKEYRIPEGIAEPLKRLERELGSLNWEGVQREMHELSELSVGS